LAAIRSPAFRGKGEKYNGRALNISKEKGLKCNFPILQRGGLLPEAPWIYGGQDKSLF